MATQRSTSVGLGRFSATVLLKNKDQKPPKYEKMNCVDTTVTQSPETQTHKQKPPTIKPPQTKPSKGQLKWHPQLLIIKSHQGQK